nr:hypothetical protein [Streptomyces sp. SPB074]
MAVQEAVHRGALAARAFQQVLQGPDQPRAGAAFGVRAVPPGQGGAPGSVRREQPGAAEVRGEAFQFGEPGAGPAQGVRGVPGVGTEEGEAARGALHDDRLGVSRLDDAGERRDALGGLQRADAQLGEPLDPPLLRDHADAAPESPVQHGGGEGARAQVSGEGVLEGAGRRVVGLSRRVGEGDRRGEADQEVRRLLLQRGGQRDQAARLGCQDVEEGVLVHGGEGAVAQHQGAVEDTVHAAGPFPCLGDDPPRGGGVGEVAAHVRGPAAQRAEFVEQRLD